MRVFVNSWKPNEIATTRSRPRILGTEPRRRACRPLQGVRRANHLTILSDSKLDQCLVLVCSARANLQNRRFGYQKMKFCRKFAII